MKVWKVARILKRSKNLDLITKSYINYIYKNSPLNELKLKYNISNKDIYNLKQYTANRIAGLLLLYLTKDSKRLQDIAVKYNTLDQIIDDIVPEIEGYIEK